MWSAAPSVVASTTRPRTAKYRLGSSGSATLTATRGSRPTLRTFWWVSTVLISTCDPSVSTQVRVSCGEPSGIVVATKQLLGRFIRAISSSGSSMAPSQQVAAVFRATGGSALPGHGGLQHRLGQRTGPAGGDLLVLGIGHHRAERRPGRVADQQHRVPVLTRLRDQRGGAVAGVEHLGAVPGEERRVQRLGVSGVGLPAALGEAQQVEHHDGAAGILLEVALEIGTAGIDRHDRTVAGAL